MVKQILIVGGGTAGWLTACYLARMIGAREVDGARITLVESEDIGIIGVGEGTFPSIRKTLNRLEIDEAALIRDANATFKQGVRFDNWRRAPSVEPTDRYYHPFQTADQHTDLDLLPYWLLGAAGDEPWSRVGTVQQAVIDAHRAPKLIEHPDYAGPLAYAYHFDAVAFGQLLRRHALERGVTRIADTIEAVRLAPDGAIESLTARASGRLEADLYIDCTGFRAQLIGQALGSPFTSYRDQLFCDRALAVQLPYARPDVPIASCTISTAQESGWTWDIGLQERRGVGYVFSSAHTSEARAAEVLGAYAGVPVDQLEPRLLKFEAGFRHVQWRKNCVAIGLSAGFIEPLEATGIGFAEIAALILVNLFPWAGEYDQAAAQFNAQMRRRYDHVIDFIKLHYCLSQRDDTDFWRDNRAPASISDSLKTKLDIWRWRPPSFLDVDLSHDIFIAPNWQYVLYGMGFRTDLSGRAGALRYHDAAREEFASIREQSRNALRIMPDHRALVEQVRRTGFRRSSAAQQGGAR